MMAGRKRFAPVLGLLTVALLVTLTMGVMLGPVPIPATQVWGIALDHLAPGLVTPTWSRAVDDIVWQVRFPRVLLGAFVGAGLAVVGTTLQALVRNPLADPYLFGISSGASVGAVVVILLGLALFGVFSLSIAAFLGGLVAFVLVFVLAQRDGDMSPMRLILAGVAVSYLLSAITSFLVFQADSTGAGSQVRSVLFWMLGGLGGARWEYLVVPAPVVAVGTVVLALQWRRLNALVVGEESALSLGVDTRRFRRWLFILTALLTGVMVAVSGGIVFVGLVIPHMVRIVVGADHRRVLPAAALVGAIFLVWVDVAARLVVAPAELPIGIITAVVGAPVFIWLLRRRGTAGGAVAA
jgi:iron complex transport system permease protein